MDEGSRTRGSGSVSEMTQPILGNCRQQPADLAVEMPDSWSLFALCACFSVDCERTPCVLQQTCFRVKNVFNHQPVF